MRLLKNIAIAVIALHLCQATAHGELPFKKKLNVGIKAGVSISHFTRAIGPYEVSSNGFHPDHRVSYEFGGVGRYYFSKAFILQGEIIADMKGMSYRKQLPDITTYTSAGESKTYFYNTYCLDYIELPLTAGLNVTKLLFNDQAKGGIIISSGIAPSYCFNAAFKDGGSPLSWAVSESEIIESQPINGEEKKMLLNLLSEISFNSPVGTSTRVFIYCRMMKAAGNIFRSTDLNGYNLSTSMVSLSFGAGLLF